MKSSRSTRVLLVAALLAVATLLGITPAQAQGPSKEVQCHHPGLDEDLYFSLRPDGQLMHRYYNGSYSQWMNFADNFGANGARFRDVDVLYFPELNEVLLFAVTRDGKIMHWYYTSSWNAPLDFGQKFGAAGVEFRGVDLQVKGSTIDMKAYPAAGKAKNWSYVSGSGWTGPRS